MGPRKLMAYVVTGRDATEVLNLSKQCLMSFEPNRLEVVCDEVLVREGVAIFAELSLPVADAD